MVRRSFSCTKRHAPTDPSISKCHDHLWLSCGASDQRGQSHDSWPPPTSCLAMLRAERCVDHVQVSVSISAVAVLTARLFYDAADSRLASSLAPPVRSTAAVKIRLSAGTMSRRHSATAATRFSNKRRLAPLLYGAHDICAAQLQNDEFALELANALVLILHSPPLHLCTLGARHPVDLNSSTIKLIDRQNLSSLLARMRACAKRSTKSICLGVAPAFLMRMEFARRLRSGPAAGKHGSSLAGARPACVGACRTWLIRRAVPPPARPRGVCQTGGGIGG